MRLLFGVVLSATVAALLVASALAQDSRRAEASLGAEARSAKAAAVQLKGSQALIQIAQPQAPAAQVGGILRRILRRAGPLTVAVFIASALAWVHAQTTRSIPRPPAQQPEAPPAGSAAPDGYSPIPEWAGQTRAPRVSVSVPYTAEAAATGISSGYSIEFMPDGRILLVERPGRLKIIDRSGQLSAPVAGLPPMYAGGPQGLVGAIADRDFATNHIVYLAYTSSTRGFATSVKGQMARCTC